MQQEPIEFEGETFIVGDHLKHYFQQLDPAVPSGEDGSEATDIKTLRSNKQQANEEGRLPVYSLSGRRVATVESTDCRLEGLKRGMYIIGGKKFIIR